MKKNIILILTFVVSFNIHADEGMWIPILLNQNNNINRMQQLGCKLSADDIYSINKSSLKDAVVLFGGGCTAELISDEGLLITNHHCGFSQIQSHSAVEHDYLKDGFWAMVSLLALKRVEPKSRFLAHGGMRPQLMTSIRLVESR